MKRKKQFMIEEETLHRFEHYAQMTNRSFSELIIEATEQMMRRYVVDKHRSLKKELSDIIKIAQHMYQIVPDEASEEHTGHIPYSG